MQRVRQPDATCAGFQCGPLGVITGFSVMCFGLSSRIEQQVPSCTTGLRDDLAELIKNGPKLVLEDRAEATLHGLHLEH
jgi:hypothetical protein